MGNPTSLYNENPNIVNICIYRALQIGVSYSPDDKKRKHIIQQEMIERGGKSLKKYTVHRLPPKKKNWGEKEK